MRLGGLISFEEAARRLGVSDFEIDELIDAGALTTRPWMGDVFLDAVEVESRVESLESTAGPRGLSGLTGSGRMRGWSGFGG